MIERAREFFEMGGYALYIWPAWALAVVVLGGLAVTSLRARAQARSALAQLDERT